MKATFLQPVSWKFFVTAGAVSAHLLASSLGQTPASAPLVPPPSAPSPAAPGLPAKPGAAAKSLAIVDQKFLKETAGNFFLEMELTTLAQTSGSLEGVKSSAGEINKDLNTAWPKLTALCAAKGEKVPSVLTGADKGMVERLKKSHPENFDHPYLREMEREAKHVLHDLEQASKSSEDAEIKAFATENLATAKTHVEKIDKAQHERKPLN